MVDMTGVVLVGVSAVHSQIGKERYVLASLNEIDW